MPSGFPMASRLLHWTMAAMVLAMLFIGIAMVGSLADYHRLVAIHRPLGIFILVLVALRLANRLIRPAPPLPLDMPGILRFAAHASHALHAGQDRKSTRLNSSHQITSYAVFCFKKKKGIKTHRNGVHTTHTHCP